MKNKTVKIKGKVMVIITMTSKKGIMEEFMKLVTSPMMTGKNKIIVPGLKVKKEGKMIKNKKMITTEEKEHDQKKRNEVAGYAILGPEVSSHLQVLQ
jgi:hypothetical protein